MIKKQLKKNIRLVNLLSISTAFLGFSTLNAGELTEHPSYGFNFVNYTDSTVENDGLFGWNITGNAKLINNSGGLNSYLRLSDDNSSRSLVTYNDFGYFQPNESDFTFMTRLRISDYLASGSKVSLFRATVATGSKVLEVTVNKNGVFCRNSKGRLIKVSKHLSNGYDTYSFVVKGGVLQEVFINNKEESFSPFQLRDSKDRSIKLESIGKTSKPLVVDIDHVFLYSNPSYINMVEAKDNSFNRGGSGQATQFMHLGNGNSGIPIGVNEDGGGYITQVYNSSDGVSIEKSKKTGPVLDPEPRFGSGSNQSVRGLMHRNRYNPVQAGISSNVGHVANITKLKNNGSIATTSTATKTIVVEQFPTYNDPTTDYAEHTNFDFDVNGVKVSSTPTGNGPEIDDGFNEIAISGTEEGLTELDFNGYFEDATTNDDIPTMLSYGEWKYVRPPCHILQLSRLTGSINTSQTPAQISRHRNRDHIRTMDTDLGSMRIMREVRANSDLGYTWIHWMENGKRKKLQLTTPVGNNKGVSSLDFECLNPTSKFIIPDNNVVILAKSSNWNADGAVGIYYPDSAVNVNGTVGYHRNSDKQQYAEDRRTSVAMRVDWVKANWVRLRLLTYSRGLFAPSRVHKDVYEGFRSENYTIFGSPKEIFNKAKSLK